MGPKTKTKDVEGFQVVTRRKRPIAQTTQVANPVPQPTQPVATGPITSTTPYAKPPKHPSTPIELDTNTLNTSNGFAILAGNDAHDANTLEQTVLGTTPHTVPNE